jgi:hypothetical protein
MKSCAHLAVAALLALTLGVGVGESSHGVTTTCPAPGTTVLGTLDVTGDCVLDHVTVNGSVIVENGGALEMEFSRVVSGITVKANGELDVGHDFVSTKTYNPNSIGGNVVMTSPVDYDVSTVELTATHHS